MSFRIFLSILLVSISQLLFSTALSAQSVSIGGIIEEQMQIYQLTDSTSQLNFFSRPVTFDDYLNIADFDDNSSQWWKRHLSKTEIYKNRLLSIGLHPISIQNTYNTRFPKGENNGAAWYGRGNTIELMGGIYVRNDFFTLDFQPHVAYQENKDFLHPRFTTRNRQGDIRYIHVPLGVRFDVPFRFGPDPYTTFDLGYSSIRFRYSKLETGLSTEPLWWGPAVRYPLLMSNNAPGFPHYFFNSREPIRIPYFGKIQFSWIMGYPKESEYFDGQESGMTRFSNGVNISYSPIFFDNLTIGLTRFYHIYEIDGFDIQNVVRIFDPFSRSALVRQQGGDEVRQNRNQIASAYINLNLPGSNARIYAEFFREDHSFDLRDLFIQPHHNSAYSIGLQKVVYVSHFDLLKVNLEFTSLTASQLAQVRPQVFFYGHSDIRQGHTNRGKILGAAIGPGSNSQFIGFDLYKDNYRFGFFGQRIADNENFHFREGSVSQSPAREFGDFYRHRIDLNFGFSMLYGSGPIFLNSQIIWTKAYNYGRFDLANYENVSIINHDPFDRTNVQFQIGFTYML